MEIEAAVYKQNLKLLTHWHSTFRFLVSGNIFGADISWTLVSCIVAELTFLLATCACIFGYYATLQQL
jgi:hypothetical protein